MPNCCIGCWRYPARLQSVEIQLTDGIEGDNGCGARAKFRNFAPAPVDLELLQLQAPSRVAGLQVRPASTGIRLLSLQEELA